MEKILEVEGLRTYLYTRAGIVQAVDDVSFHLNKGETLGIVGESGSGKSMTALSLVRLVPRPAARIISGSVRLQGRELLDLSDKEMRSIRGQSIAMILQDPQTSLNPVFTAGWQIEEAMKRLSGRNGRIDRRRRAVEALRMVQVADPERRVKNYPHEMSGGMKQRVVGTIAMQKEPQVLIADEPTTALDVTIQAQYLRLLRNLKEKQGVSLIFITHDFGIVANMCDRVAVMYAGRIVETGTVKEIFEKPLHPYTQALIASVPSPDRRVEWLTSIEGNPPVLSKLPIGCRFAPRCSHEMKICRDEYPPTFNEGAHVSETPNHFAACWLLSPQACSTQTQTQTKR